MEDGFDEAAQIAAEHAAATAADPDNRPRARKSRPAALRPDTPEGVCANCETDLQGPVCHSCGQLADEYHRPVRGLLGELIEGFFALDGRVARTLPNLLARPGRVTRDYLKGKRARYMPPFRLYIIASLIFFLLVPGIDQLTDGVADGAAGFSDAMNEDLPSPGVIRERIESQLEASVAAGEMTQEEADQALAGLGQIGLSPADPPAGPADADALQAAPDANTAAGDETERSADGAADVAGRDGPVEGEAGGFEIGPGVDPDEVRRFFAPEDFGEAASTSALPLPVRRYLGERFAEVTGDPGGWAEAAADWVPRIMFVMVPIYALLLSLTYAWRRRFFFFDHLIVSLHFHSALFLAMSVGLLIGGGWAFAALLVYSNLYLYRLHRVVYERGRFSSVLRTLVLDIAYLVVMIFGFFAVLLLGALAG